MQVEQTLHHFPSTWLGRSNELNERFGVIGGDELVRQRRPQSFRMRCLRDIASSSNTQAFAFDTAHTPAEQTSAIPLLQFTKAPCVHFTHSLSDLSFVLSTKMTGSCRSKESAAWQLC